MTRCDGIILHGSRGGAPTRRLEWEAMQRYAAAGAAGLCWHVTVFDSMIAEHCSAGEWGWHCRSLSRTWLGIEFVQPNSQDDITDEQVEAAAWWIRERVLARWHLPDLALFAHSETEPGIADGKSDVFPADDPRLATLKWRLLQII